MMLNAAPLNAAPINGVAFSGAITNVSVDAQGVGRASTNSTTLTVVVDPLGQTDVKMVGSRTAGVHVNPSGSGATNNVWAGVVSFVTVSSEGGGSPVEFVSGSSTTIVELLSFAQYGSLFEGGLSRVDVVDTGYGTPIGYSQTGALVDSEADGGPTIGVTATIEVLTTAAPFITGPATAIVEVDQFAAVSIKQAGFALVSVQGLDGKGFPLSGQTTAVEALTESGSMVGAGSEPVIEVTPVGFMSLAVGSTVEVPVRGEYAPSKVQVTGSFDSVINVTPEHPNNLLGWALSNVEALASGDFALPGGSLSTVEVIPKSIPSVRGLADSLAVNEVLGQFHGTASGGKETTVEVQSDSRGMILSRNHAPDFRTVYVPPKRKGIVFTGDDRSLKMAGEYEKQPREVVDYDFDLTDWFAGNNDDDFITQVKEVLIAPAGELVLGSDGTADIVLQGSPARRFKIWLSGGVDGGEYKVTALVKTNIGRVEEIDFTVRVEEQ